MIVLKVLSTIKLANGEMVSAGTVYQEKSMSRIPAGIVGLLHRGSAAVEVLSNVEEPYVEEPSSETEVIEVGAEEESTEAATEEEQPVKKKLQKKKRG